MSLADKRRQQARERREQPTMSDGDYPIIHEPCAVCERPIGRLGSDGVRFMDKLWRHHGCAGKKEVPA